MKRLLHLFAIAVSVSCHTVARSPTEPDAVTPSVTSITPFAGVWTGEYRITGIDGTGQRAGTLVPFVLRLDQEGTVVRGSFQTHSVLIDVTGIVDHDGVMSLQGAAPGLGQVDFVGAATLTDFHVQLDPATGLAGAFSYRLDRTAETPLGFTTRYVAEIARAQRATKLLLPTFDGAWTGRFIVRQCERPCGVPFVNETGGFTLRLLQSGSRVTGDIVFTLSDPPLPVSGHIDGDRLVLDPSTTTGRYRIVEWSTERTRYGRMTGSFTYDQADGFQHEVELGPVWQLP